MEAGARVNPGELVHLILPEELAQHCDVSFYFIQRSQTVCNLFKQMYLQTLIFSAVYFPITISMNFYYPSLCYYVVSPKFKI